MALTHAQKKFLKKHGSVMTVPELSRRLHVPEGEIESHLTRVWGERKFRVRMSAPVPFQPRSFRMRAYLPQIAAIILLTIAAYANSVTGGFISDDKRYLVENPLTGSFSFVTATPVTIFKSFINFLTILAFGLSPWAFHTVNIMFHALSAVMVFAILTSFTGWQAAALGGAVVAVHPVFTESVSWIGGGGYAMYGSLFLVSFYLYATSDKNRKRRMFAVIAFLLSLLSSEKAIPLTMAYPLYEFARGTAGRNFAKYVPFVCAGFIWAAVVFGVIGYGQARVEALESDFAVSGYYNPLVQIPVAISSYIGLLFYPRELSFFYSRLQFPLPEFIFRAGITAAFIAAVAVSFFRNRLVFFFLILVPVTLASSLTPLTVAWVVAERYAYLAAIWMIIALAVWMDGISAKKKRILIALILFIVPALLVRTVIRNFDWTSEDTLWFATYRTAPEDPRVHNNVGEYYLKRKEYEKAEPEFQEAIRLTSTRPAPYYNLGLLYYRTGDYGQAEEYLKKSVSVSDTFADGYRILSSLYFDRNEYENALSMVTKLKELEPENPLVYLNLGMIYAKLGQTVDARQNLEYALSLDPQNNAARKALEQLPVSP